MSKASYSGNNTGINRNNNNISNGESINIVIANSINIE